MALLFNLAKNWLRSRLPSAAKTQASAPSADLLRAAAERLAGGDFSAAAELYRQATEAAPAQAATWNGLAVAANHLEDFSLAESALRRGLALAPGDAVMQCNLAVTLVRQQRHAEAETVARNVLAADDKLAEAHFALAEVLAARADLAEAEIHYARSAELDGTLASCRNVRFGPAFFDSLGAQALPQKPELVLTPAADTDFDHIVLVAADAIYFEKFGSSFLSSYAQNADANGLLLVHLVDGDADWPERILRLARQVGLKAIAVSAEPSWPNLNQDMRRVYYACARFLHLPHWLAQFGRPVLCMDIDAVVRASPRLLLAACQDSDLGLILRDAPYSPWTHILAGVVAANPTAAASAYLDCVARYIGHFLRAGEAYWGLDQIALYCVLRRCEALSSTPRIRKINDEAESVAWQLSRKLGPKESDALYMQYRVAI